MSYARSSSTKRSRLRSPCPMLQISSIPAASIGGHLPLRGLEAAAQPGLVRQRALDFGDVVHRALVVPPAAKPAPHTAPEVAGMVRWIAGQRRAIGEVGRPAL